MWLLSGGKHIGGLHVGHRTDYEGKLPSFYFDSMFDFDIASSQVV
jgi:hypothetical protein